MKIVGECFGRLDFMIRNQCTYLKVGGSSMQSSMLQKILGDMVANIFSSVIRCVARSHSPKEDAVLFPFLFFVVALLLTVSVPILESIFGGSLLN